MNRNPQFFSLSQMLFWLNWVIALFFLHTPSSQSRQYRQSSYLWINKILNCNSVIPPSVFFSLFFFNIIIFRERKEKIGNLKKKKENNTPWERPTVIFSPSLCQILFCPRYLEEGEKRFLIIIVCLYRNYSDLLFARVSCCGLTES
jgi:hypothetical protein